MSKQGSVYTHHVVFGRNLYRVVSAEYSGMQVDLRQHTKVLMTKTADTDDKHCSNARQLHCSVFSIHNILFQETFGNSETHTL